MFKQKTVFIVGAGASAEVDFPVGTQLARQIGAKMDVRFERGFDPIGSGDHALYSHLTHFHPQEAQELQDAAWRIRDGIAFAQSIDDFLDQHRTDPHVNLYGKAAIVQAVVEAERGSKLFFDRTQGAGTFDDQKIADTWFVKFMHMLCRGVAREDVAEVFNQLTFIVFNYDRCIEHFLLNGLQRAYSISATDAASIVDDLDIFHPYGSIGDLQKVPFGSTRINCVALSEAIKTYTEQVTDADSQARLTGMLTNAQQIVFLGFAYHDQNMALLRPATELPASKKIFGTAYGLSNSDVTVVGHQIDAWFTGRNAQSYRSTMIRLEPTLKCAGLLDNYARSLTS